MSDLAAVYADLHAILAPYAARLVTTRDDGTELYVDTRHVQKNRKPLFFGAVQWRKRYVSFHLMPVYVQPELLATASPQLKARMQGKSCFNFAAPDAPLYAELAALVAAGYDSYRRQGFVP